MQETGFPAKIAPFLQEEWGMYPTSSLRGLKRRLCFTRSQTPALSKQTCKAGSRWKLPTQGLAPSLPEPGKHETIPDETRLESHRA